MKSISKAAEHMHVSQPTLSSRLHKVEEGLGFTLFERSWEGVTLTKKGYYFLPYAIQLFQDISNASTVLTDYVGENMTSFEEVTNNTNRLQIGIDNWLHPLYINLIMDVLNTNFPELSYKFITRPSQTIYDLLKYDGLHLGIFYSNDPNDDSFTKTLTIDEMMLLYYANEPFDIKKDLTNIDLLKDKPFILFDNPVLSHHRHVTQHIISLLDIENFHIVDNIHVMLNMVTNGNGYTIVPKSSVFKYINSELYAFKYIPLGTMIPKMRIKLTYANNVQFKQPLQMITKQLTAYTEESYI